VKGVLEVLIKEISVFLENRPGRVAEVTSILGEKGIDIWALTISDTSRFGILRIIVDKPELAEKVLKERELTVSCTNVLAISVKDKPGGLASVLELLAGEELSVEYMYAVGRYKEGAVIIIKAKEPERAVERLGSSGINVLSGDALADL